LRFPPRVPVRRGFGLEPLHLSVVLPYGSVVEKVNLKTLCPLWGET
jgi:hypothetical protein